MDFTKKKKRSLMDSPTSPTQNPSSIISTLLSFSDSSPISIDRELEKALAYASDDASVQECLLNRTIQLASFLLESTKRTFRKRATAHNSSSWFLPPELTVKVFSMLDTKSLMQAAACCTMFKKCVMDPFSYAHVDLTKCTSEVEGQDLCNLFHRAGKELRSLKLGSLGRRSYSSGYFSLSFVDGPFLSSLCSDSDFFGSGLKSLRLYNIRWTNFRSSFKVCTEFNMFSGCPNLTDLRIVGLTLLPNHLFQILAENCRLIEHLCIETYGLRSTMDTVEGSHLIEFVTNSPNLTSLRFFRFRLTDEVACLLAQSCRSLKYLNLSRSPKIRGHFLRVLGESCKESPLKTLIMRNCHKLHEKEVLELCNSLIKGNFKSIRHIDVSNNRGLVSDDGERSYRPKFPLEKLKEERPNVTLVADFPSPLSVKHYPVCHEEDEEELREIEMKKAGSSFSDDDSSSSDDDPSSSDDDSEEDLG